MKKNGFTLIEMLVVMFIAVVVTTLTLVNFRGGGNKNLLRSTAQDVISDLRSAQNMALASQKFGANMPYGYGIYFSLSSPQSYIIFADLNNNRSYSGSSEIFRTVSLPNEIEIYLLNPSPAANFFFAMPEADVNLPGSVGLRIVGTSETQRVNITNEGVIGF